MLEDKGLEVCADGFAVTLDGHDDDAEESEVKFGQSCNWRDDVK